jgi:ABC-2 type transport system permease protein
LSASPRPEARQAAPASQAEAAPALAVILALARHELALTARRGENVLVTLFVPPAVMVFFATTGILPGVAGRPVDFLVPGTLALAVIASGLVNLGIATAYERSYGVLKRLGGAPIPRGGLVVAKVAAVLVLELVQVAVVVGVATLALGWTFPTGTWVGLAALALVLGTLAFAGLGLLMAGTLRAEATLALANGLFLLFLMIGGIVLPVDHLPAPLATIAPYLPASALADLFRATLGAGADPTVPSLVLAAWGIASAWLAAITFRWE